MLHAVINMLLEVPQTVFSLGYACQPNMLHDMPS